MEVRMNKKVITGIVAVVITALVGVGAYFVLKPKKQPAKKKVVETTTVEVTTKDPYAGKVQSYLTGEMISKKRKKKRPVAIMINNIKDAIPQYGISKAEVMYEAPVEGGITRLMAIMDDYDNLKRIGSIRSCRIYYTRFALEWDAIYSHFGQSKYALKFLKSGKIDTVNSFTAGDSFYRTSDKPAPHNCYISGKNMNSAIKKLKRRSVHKKYNGTLKFVPFKSKANLVGKVKKAKTVSMGYSHNASYYKYDKKNKVYKRYQFGQKHIDATNKKQLTFKNIIIQAVDYKMFPDKKSLKLKLTGSGKGYYITNGKAEKITWKKDDDLGKTTFLDKNGNEILVNTGKTMINIVQKSMFNGVKIK